MKNFVTNSEDISNSQYTDWNYGPAESQDILGTLQDKIDLLFLCFLFIVFVTFKISKWQFNCSSAKLLHTRFKLGVIISVYV